MSRAQLGEQRRFLGCSWFPWLATSSGGRSPRTRLASLASLAILPFACAGKPKVEPATLVLNQGKIVTVDDQKPEAQALAARGDTIVAVGTNEEIASYVGPQTRVVDLHGRLAIPGFIDGHGHFTGVGEARITLNLTKVKS